MLLIYKLAEPSLLQDTRTCYQLKHVHFINLKVYRLFTAQFGFKMASATTSLNHVAQQAHQQHDLFNLVCLPVIVLVNTKALHAFFLAESSSEDLDFYWTMQIAALNVYIFFDTCWIMLNPDSVSALKTILMHHCIVFFGWLLVPQQVVPFRPIATCLLSVEINTVFMIARKFQPFQKYPFLLSFLRCGFYLTWVPLRVIIFPYCCYLGYLEVVQFERSSGSFLNIATVGWVLLLVITCLNIKWTVDLFFLKACGNSNEKNKQ